jgi:hypothetical protein
MSSHPINLMLRFLLELSALAVAGYWGWATARGRWRLLLAIGLPLLLALLWGVFAVPDDPSRSGRAPVPVPGALRLLLELAVFAFAAWALYDVGRPVLGLILAVVVVAHYILSYDRITWLVRK